MPDLTLAGLEARPIVSAPAIAFTPLAPPLARRIVLDAALAPESTWPIKDPQDVLDVGIDFSQALGVDGDALASVVWHTPVGLTQVKSGYAGGVAFVWLAGGVGGQSYRVAVTVVTQYGRTYERGGLLRVYETGGYTPEAALGLVPVGVRAAPQVSVPALVFASNEWTLTPVGVRSGSQVSVPALSAAGFASLAPVGVQAGSQVSVPVLSAAGFASLTPVGVRAGSQVSVPALTTSAALLLIVAGQSNSRTAGNSSATPAAKYTTGTPFSGVTIFERGTGGTTLENIAAGTFENYDITSNADPDNTGTAWGSEAEFIYQMRQAGDMRDVYIVKESQNGQDLATAWNPATSNDNFEHLEAKMTRARALVAAGFGEEVTLWNQGEADANDETKSDNYASNFSAFLAAYRSRVSTGLFVAERIRPLGYEGASVTTNSAGFLRAWQVREATLAGVVGDGNATAVDTDFIESNFDSIHPVEPWTEGKGLRCYEAYDGTYDATYGSILDAVPDAFAFADVTEATPSAVVLSEAVLIAGLERQAAVSITGGEYRTLNSLDSDAVVTDWTSAAGFVDKYQKIQVRQTASASNSTGTDVVLTIGGVSDTWTVTTFASAPSYEAETDAFIAQVTTNGGGTISGADADALDAFYVAAKASTWWPKIFRMYASLGDATASSLDLVGQSVSMVDASPDPINAWVWSAGTGWAGQASSNGGMDLQVNPSTDMPQNDCAFGLWYSAYASGTQGELTSLPNDHMFMRNNTGGATRAKVHQTSNTTATGVSVAHVGLRVGQREGASLVKIYDYNGAELDSETDASVTPADTQMILGNTGGVYSDASIAGFFAADEALTPAEIAAMDATVEALQAHFAGASSVFDPATLFSGGEEGVALDTANSFTDTGGTTAATTGDSVARVNDLSGNGNHVTQAVVAERPDLTADGSLDFDGTDDNLTLMSSGLGSDMTIVMAIKSADSQVLLLSGGTGSQHSHPAHDGSTGSTCAASGMGAADLYVDNAFIDQSTVTRDGLHATLCDDAWHSVRIQNADVSAWTNLFFSGYAGWRLGGEVGPRILVIDRDLTAGELADVESWVMEGLT
jgi:hypothetical protein